MNELSLRSSFSRRRLKKDLGLIVAMVVACVLFGWFFLRGRSDWPERLALAAQIVSVVSIPYFVYLVARIHFGQKRWNQTAIMKLKRQEENQFHPKRTAIIYTLVGFLQIGVGLLSAGVLHNQVWVGVLFLVMAIHSWTLDRSKILICPQGIWNYEMTRWEEIERYEWENDDLWVRRKNSPIRFSEFCLAIDESQKDEVEQILREKVGELEDT